jgi:hypothetical protein
VFRSVTLAMILLHSVSLLDLYPVNDQIFWPEYRHVEVRFSFSGMLQLRANRGVSTLLIFVWYGSIEPAKVSWPHSHKAANASEMESETAILRIRRYLDVVLYKI